MKNKDKILYISVMALYGTTGILKHFVPYSSAFVAFIRALIASIFIFAFMKLKGKSLNRSAVRENLPKLIAVGVLLGFNWIAYFEACRLSTVAKATLCYYMAPVIVMLLSPLLYGEKLTGRKICCITVAVIGMALVSGVFGDKESAEAKGLLIGFLAALIYAAIVILSRRINNIEALDKTLVQLAVAACCLFPYWLLADGEALPEPSFLPVLLVIIIGILNTGIAYVIYFGTVTKLKAQTVAIFAYADPVVSVLLSAFLLKEPLGIGGAIGAALIIGAMILSEL